jgi:oligoendopeptidase F
MTKYRRSWKLDNIYPGIDSEEFKKDLDRLNKETDGLIEKSKELPPIDKQKSTADTWKDFYKDFDEFYQLMFQLVGYVNNRISADTENEELSLMRSRLSKITTKAPLIHINIASRLKNCDDNTFEIFINNNETLKEVKFAIAENREHTKYQMEEDKERLASKLSPDGLIAWGRLYEKFSSKLKVELEENGKTVKKSVGQVKWESPDRNKREKEFKASLKAWDSIKDICAESLNHLTGTRVILQKERGYKHYLDDTLLKCRLRRESLDAMWEAVNDRKQMFKTYFDIKAKLLGLEKLNWFDLRAPMSEGKIDFDNAMGIIIEQYTKFNPEMGEFAKWTVENGFIESEDREGKKPGAYCMYFRKRKEPRIFMTFTNSYSSMSTVAHELGHAYHNYVLKDRPYSLSSYPMNLAETASTFGEAIISDYLINNAKTKEEKIAILDKLISDSANYLMNIHSRYLFECSLYEEQERGFIPPSRLNEMMLDAQRKAYIGLLGEYHPLFWASKLHFYITGLSFYNFPYTFGFLFSKALYSIAKQKGSEFAQTYNDILVSTGCMNTEDVVSKNLNMDITKKDFWYKSLDLIKEKIDDFVKISS